MPTSRPLMRTVSHGMTPGKGAPLASVQLAESHLKEEAAIRATSVSRSSSNSWLPNVA